jgi:hypothetical protein
VFKTFTENSTEPIRAHLGESSPERRARIECLVVRYPDLEPKELAELLHWYRREASAMDVALLASSEDATEPFGAFCRDHIAPFNWKHKAVTALLTAGTLGLIGFAFVGDA